MGHYDAVFILRHPGFVFVPVAVAVAVLVFVFVFVIRSFGFYLSSFLPVSVYFLLLYIFVFRVKLQRQIFN